MFKKLVTKYLPIIAIAVFVPLLLATSAAADTLLFGDDFNYPDSDAVGNGWAVDEGGGDVDIFNNRLYFADTNDLDLRPIVSHGFSSTGSGFLSWSFVFDWSRIGSEGTYRIFMQLGKSSEMSDFVPDLGVGVNLVWTFIGGGHEMLGYIQGGGTTSLTTVSGSTEIQVMVDLDAKSYTVFVEGAGLLCGIPFDNAVALDTVRFISDQLNDGNFSGRSFDDVDVWMLEAPPSGIWAPVAQNQTVSTDANIDVDITLEAVDCDDEVLDYSIVDPPDQGDLTGTPPDVTYSPDPGYTGTDSFTFIANDGKSDSNIATVSINIAGDSGSFIDIADYVNSSGGEQIIWKKARYEDLNISGTATRDIPFGLAYPYEVDGDWTGTMKYPLLLYLHGAGARGDDNQALNLSTAMFFAESSRTNPDWRAFVLTPQCPGSHRWVEWNWGDGPYNQTDTPGNTYGEYMYLVENLVYYLMDSANDGAMLSVLGILTDDIDWSRFYVVGESMGAYGTWDFVARQTHLVAGAIASGGSGPKNRLDELRQTPFWAIHGRTDTIVPNALPSPGDPDGAGSIGMLRLLDPGFNNTTSTDMVHLDNPYSTTDIPPVSWTHFIYSEFDAGHNPPASNWTQIPTPGVREWLFAQSLNTCPGDRDSDNDVDGADLVDFIDNFDLSRLGEFAPVFGRLCP
jgi:predicted esterase